MGSDTSAASAILRRPGATAAQEFAKAMEKEARIAGKAGADAAVGFVLQQAQADPWILRRLQSIGDLKGKSKLKAVASAVMVAMRRKLAGKRSSAPADSVARVASGYLGAADSDAGELEQDGARTPAGEASDTVEARPFSPPHSRTGAGASEGGSSSRRHLRRRHRASIASRVAALDSVPSAQGTAEEEAANDEAGTIRALGESLASISTPAAVGPGPGHAPAPPSPRQHAATVVTSWPEPAPLSPRQGAAADVTPAPSAQGPNASRRVDGLASLATGGDAWCAGAGLALAGAAAAAAPLDPAPLPSVSRLRAEAMALRGVGSWLRFDILEANRALTAALTGSTDAPDGGTAAGDGAEGLGLHRFGGYDRTMRGPDTQPVTRRQGEEIAALAAAELTAAWEAGRAAEAAAEEAGGEEDASPFSRPGAPAPPPAGELLLGALWNTESPAALCGGMTAESGLTGWGRELLEALAFRSLLEAAAPPADVATWERKAVAALPAGADLVPGGVPAPDALARVPLPPAVARAVAECDCLPDDAAAAAAGFAGALPSSPPPAAASSGVTGTTGAAWPWEWEADVHPAAARRLASLIASLYRGNLYHSALHAADVLQATRHAMVSGGLGARLTAQSRVALVLAAAAHDAGHPGVNNVYVSATGHPLALRYGDTSPLERMHAASLLELIHAHPDADVFASWSAASRRAAMRLAFSCIVHTDNAGHFAMVDKLRARAALAEPDAEHDPRSGPLCLEPGHDDEELVCQAALHASDISNPYRAWHLNCRWGDFVTHEFWLQGRRERAAGLPVGPVNDASSAAPKPFVQAGFAKIFCLPLLEGLGGLGAVDVAPWAAQLRRNVATYEVLARHARTVLEQAKARKEDEEREEAVVVIAADDAAALDAIAEIGDADEAETPALPSSAAAMAPPPISVAPPGAPGV